MMRVSVISCPFHLIFLVINFNDFSNIQKVKGTRDGGNHEDGLLEKSVENKSCLKLFSTLFSMRPSS